MFGRQPKLTTRCESQQEKRTDNQENKLVNNNRLRIARDNGIRRQGPLISQHKFYECAQGIKRIYRHNKEGIIT